MTAAVGQDLCLPGLGRALRLFGCSEVLGALQAAMPGWPARVVEAAGPVPAIRLRRHGEGYWQTSPALPEGLFLATAVEAACSLIADLVGEYFDRHPDSIGLHCGSAEVAGRLVVFPDSHRAGKSTLTTAFAAAGLRVFGDDVLALTPEGRGRALGIAPRLRLPLPASLDPALVAHADEHAGPADERYRYLALPEAALATHGEEAPLGTLVLLEREAGLTAPELLPLAPGEGLLQLLCQNFAHGAPSEALMARFLPLMASLPCLLLRYSEPLAAARCLAARVAAPPEKGEAALASLAGHRPMPAAAQAISPRQPWRPAGEVQEYPLDDELFLIHRPSGAIHRLNASGRAVWLLLAREVLSADILAELLAELYGDRSAERILPDVLGLLGRLAESRLIEAA